MSRGLITDDEWAYFEPFLVRRGGRPARSHCRVLDAVFWVMRTAAPWRDLPDKFGNWNSIFRQFRRWADSGVWGVMLEALAGSGVSDGMLGGAHVRRKFYDLHVSNGSEIAKEALEIEYDGKPFIVRSAPRPVPCRSCSA